MDREGGYNSNGFYSVLGIRKEASFSDIRTAYRKLALKWHPDRWGGNPGAALDAKKRFQQIQEAYSVLSDEGKRSMYDAGLYDCLEDEDEDFCDFMQEMLSMMNNVKDEGDSFEDLQRMFTELVGGDGMTMMGFDINEDPTAKKRARGTTTSKGKAAKRSNSRC
uniref:J domain-containing protein n=1 Tax=Fagus sylvatica TaxID=28930 RepID=A0A2N9IX52_FAGSY